MRRLTPHERDTYINRIRADRLKNIAQEREIMDTVNVRIIDLLVKLKENREAHHDTFLLARDGYREHAKGMFAEQLHLAEQGWSFQNSVILDPPKDHTRDYDQAIQMLEMSLVGFVEPQLQHLKEDQVKEETPRLRNMATIEISKRDFACFVRDDWGWKDEWFANTRSYIVS